MFRSRSWMDVIWNKPKVRLSLEHLKYLHSVLDRHTTVSESNRGLLVESLRCIAEILIWGDQNDSSVFDFFLEKNMLLYFLHIMRQKSGGSSFVCVQLLQTLNILFENIRNETSLYYLLSNNHVNSIIVHKFDFSDEDVMGYYILFLKTLSLKLNTHTIHFFYNEHTNDFPLYTEAIKFFNHPESMVRIAVRTISLNVYRVQNSSMLQFIRDKTAAPYFSNLVWFIGKHILELDTCVRNDTDHQSHSRLSNLVAEHLDHLHYLNDILCLDIPDLNAVLTEHLLHKLFVPLYIFSLTPAPPPLSIALVTQNLAAVLNKTVDIDIQEINNPRVSCVVALFLLSLVFLVITHGPLVHSLAWVILNADHNVFKDGAAEVLNAYIERREVVALGFGQPHESLEQSLDTTIMQSSTLPIDSSENSFQSSSSTATGGVRRTSLTSTSNSTESGYTTGATTSDTIIASNTSATINESRNSSLSNRMEHINITDEEKEKLKEHSIVVNGNNVPSSAAEINRPFLDMVLSSLDCTENDYISLLALCLVYALANNKGVNAEWLENILNKSKSSTTIKYKSIIIDRLLQIITLSSQPSCRVRLITLELSIKLFCQLIHLDSTECTLLESHHNVIFSAYNQCMIILRNFYKSEDIFLDLFEDEYNEMVKSVLNVEFLCMDSTILLPPTGTPLTGINFTRRLPCGDVEKARRAIRVFFYIRKLCQAVTYDQEQLLPLTNPNVCVREENVLDLSMCALSLKYNSDLIACTVMLRDGSKLRRFLVIDVLQLILVEPDTKRLGWGVAKLVGFLQDVEVVGDREDSRCLHITIHRGGGCTTNLSPILSAKFIFDDHIRCMAAKQRLTKGRSKARQKKMFQIGQLLEIGQQSSGVQTPMSMHGMSSSPVAGGGGDGGGGGGGASGGYTNAIFGGSTKHMLREHRPLFTTVHRVPGFASALRRESLPLGSVVSRVQIGGHREGRRSAESDVTSRENIGGAQTNASRPREHSKTRLITARSRDGSNLRSPRPRSEEIPLEDFRQSRNSSPAPSSSSTRIHSNVSSRSNTPSPLISDIVNRAAANGGITSTTSSNSSTAGNNNPIAGGSSNSTILHNFKDVNTQIHSNSSLNTSISNNNNNNNNHHNNSSNTIGNNGNNLKNDQTPQKKRSEETSFIATTDGKKLNVEIV